MFEKLTYEDQRQLFLQNVVMWRGKIVYVSVITRTGYLLKDLSTQKDIAGDDQTYMDFLPVYKRTGFINLDGGVIHVSRAPVRRMSFGYCSGNMKFQTVINGTIYEEGGFPPRHLTSEYILRSKDFYDSLVGNYESLRECATLANLTRSPVAFDRQFGINYDRSIFFRNQGLVGRLKDDRYSVRSIEFMPKFQYLKPLLENINGKDLRNLTKEERLW